jgi:ERCC4-related helicase
MLIDNETGKQQLHEWLVKMTKSGKMDVVTGYFTVGALAFIDEQLNGQIDLFRYVIGDIASNDQEEIQGLDLLNENLTLANVFEISSAAKVAVRYLDQDKVFVKTLEPNFCHAKAYIYKDANSDRGNGDAADFYVTGSSNLTEAGIGLKRTSNVELNMVGQGTDANYNELVTWFQNLWDRKEAHDQKTLRDPNGHVRKMPFKAYLIQEIQKLYKQYTPHEIYYKVLYELFGDRVLGGDLGQDFTRLVGRLENTKIYAELYEFQKKGVLSLIKMLQRYDGAILADAVGLGKTWQALAVMKFFEMEGYEVILLCPKKLDHNWRKYHYRHDSLFREDRLDFVIRYHTDLQDDRMDKHQDRLKVKDYFRSDRPKLLVIDESHNLRNDKSNRYKFLVEKLLKQDATLKVLLLSATPINNSMLDIRNQFKLLVKDNPRGFAENLEVKNLDHVFRKASQAFAQWQKDRDRTMRSFIGLLPPSLFKLTDALTVARTRRMVTDQHEKLDFPIKAKPENVFVTPEYIGNFESFDELFDSFPKRLSAYMPSWYVDQGKELSILEDEQKRDQFLVKMMYILMVKRLESSWSAFHVTVGRILKRHQEALDEIKEYEKTKKEIAKKQEGALSLFDEEDDLDLSEYEIGTKRAVKISDIDAWGKLNLYKRHLKEDIQDLSNLHGNLEMFAALVDKHKIADGAMPDCKLEVLIERIKAKRILGANNGNPKVLIFTVYTDTAIYLYEQLKSAGLGTVAMVSSGESHVSDRKEPIKDFEDVLERFVPFTKLYREKKWKEFDPPKGKTPKENFPEWQEFVRGHDKETWAKLQNPIDILVATDVLSEGQNLQDCDYVINYDIHWNPVRVIQRMGRIDRLGSPNAVVFGLNFWPSENINRYLDLQTRIEDRMAQMKLAGAEVDERFSEGVRRKSQDEGLDRDQIERMMRQMETTWEEIEVGEETFGFDDLSLERFRQDLSAQMQAERLKYESMPKGVFSGCLKISEHCPEEGIITLVAYPARPPKAKQHSYQSMELLYLNTKGAAVRHNQQEVLQALAMHKDCMRDLPEGLDQGEPVVVQHLSEIMQAWLQRAAGTAKQEETEDAAPTAAPASIPWLDNILQGDNKVLHQIKSGDTVQDRYQSHRYDLLAWLYVR